MKGVLLISHGEMAKGMMDTIALFFGDLKNVDYLCLYQDDNPDDFQRKLKDKIAFLDTGDGVIILGDLIGGTPLNQAAYLANDRITVIGGMNLGMLLNVMTSRENINIDFDEILENSKSSIQNLNKILGVSL